ncbi:SufD family Fe-S cluster assembly protein [Chlamydia trachomatis]|uniref:ABC transporter-associated protein n=1 Tax=Chlamydia trachomatis serovar A (strain ATCC VR-571B / DSM 19440 / HAR-13) TaxID=315277 RepID=A0A0H2X1S8_CHLTA|nr:SufD family Fe-S cluster assembly protein [Chlamydia trachomatis]AAX50964.1 ABC transporter-associated protein [Chlamydia trachomatis A/HAR-13]
MWGTHQQRQIHPDTLLADVTRSVWRQYQRDHVFREACSWLKEMTQEDSWIYCVGGCEIGAISSEERAATCVFVNGCFAPSLSVLPAEIIVAPLREARAFFQKRDEDDVVEELHSLLRGEEGTVIYIPEGTELQTPLFVQHHYVCSEEENKKTVSAPYIVFVLGKGAAISIEMGMSALPDNVYLLGKTLCFLGEEAELVLTMKPLPKGTERIIWAHHVEVERRGACALIQDMRSMGKGWFRNSFFLKGETAHGESLVKVLGGDFLGVHNTMHHDDRETTSRQNIRSILEEGSFSFEGGIYISPRGTLSNAYQKHDTLLLSNRASASTFPRLEILTDDVKASHGATVGSLNAHLLTYLRSRGFSLIEAKQALQKSFLTLDIEKPYFPKLQKQDLYHV